MKITPTSTLQPLEAFAKQIGGSFYWHQQREHKALLDIIAADGSRIVVCAKLALPLAPLDKERAQLVVAELKNGAAHAAALHSAHATWDAFQHWLMQSPELRAAYEKVIQQKRAPQAAPTDVLP